MKKYYLNLIPNAITILRIMLTLTFIKVLTLNSLFQQRKLSMSFLLLLFFSICLTDFIDGKIARHLNATSKLGSLLDVTADFIFIITSTWALVKFRLLPEWFMLIIVIKLVDFIITSKIINRYSTKLEKCFIFDYIGRAAAVSFYIIPFITIFIYQCLNCIISIVVPIMIYASTLMSAISTTQRVLMCIRIKNNFIGNQN